MRIVVSSSLLSSIIGYYLYDSFFYPITYLPPPQHYCSCSSSKRVLCNYLGVLLIITSIGILSGEFLMNYMLSSAIKELLKTVEKLPT